MVSNAATAAGSELASPRGICGRTTERSSSVVRVRASCAASFKAARWASRQVAATSTARINVPMATNCTTGRPRQMCRRAPDRESVRARSPATRARLG